MRGELLLGGATELSLLALSLPRLGQGAVSRLCPMSVPCLAVLCPQELLPSLGS